MIAVTPTEIKIKTPSGSTQGIYRRPEVDYVLMFDSRRTQLAGSVGPGEASGGPHHRRKRESTMTERKWRFQSRDAEFERVTPLWLYPELDCSSCVDDAGDQSGVGQLAFYIDQIRDHYPERWESDAVPIYWAVRGDGIFEAAPNNVVDRRKNFLSVFTPPIDAETGEPMNWWRLPVRNERFPAFAEALGWLPSPFQVFAPLRSIMTNAMPATTEETTP